MVATPATSLSLSLDAILTASQHYRRCHHHSLLSSPSSSSTHTKSLLAPGLHSSRHKSCICFHSFNNEPTGSVQHLPKSLPPTSDSFPINPSTTTNFLDPRKLQILNNFRYTRKLDSGSLEIRLMAIPEDLDATVQLLAESFAESMWFPGRYVSLLAFLVRQYVVEKRNLIPHAATIVGFYRAEGEGEEEIIAGTAEVSFDAIGMNASTPTPLPPMDCPYICNMAVKKGLRRRKIGWHLLMACEKLISQISEKPEIYLHCRVVDRGPYLMYKKAGYVIVKKDNILVWLALQRRKNLMCKRSSAESIQGFDDDS